MKGRNSHRGEIPSVAKFHFTFLMQEQIQQPLVEQREYFQRRREHMIETFQQRNNRIAEALEDISFTLKWILAFYIIAIIANTIAVLVKLPR